MPYQITTSLCANSGLCFQECPMDAIQFDKNSDRYVIDPDLCTDCGSCADVCPEGAITGLEE
ncbi:4Fe-4S binding protein [bacterium]|nr:4Fe-4S binding protein [bacterium]